MIAAVLQLSPFVALIAAVEPKPLVSSNQRSLDTGWDNLPEYNDNSIY